MSKYGVISAPHTKYLSVLSPNAGKYGPEITLYLDTFHAVISYPCLYLTLKILTLLIVYELLLPNSTLLDEKTFFTILLETYSKVSEIYIKKVML